MTKPKINKVQIKNLFDLSHPRSPYDSVSNQGQKTEATPAKKVVIPRLDHLFNTKSSTATQSTQQPIQHSTNAASNAATQTTPASSKNQSLSSHPTQTAQVPSKPSQKELDAIKATLRNEITAQVHATLKDELAQKRTAALAELEQELAKKKQDFNAQLKKDEDAAFEKARKEALSAATNEAQATVKDRLEELLGHIQSLQEEKKKVLENAQTDTLNFAIRVAEILTKTTLQEHRDKFRDLLMTALKKTTDKNRVIIRVSQPDLEFVQENLDYFKAKLKDIKTIDVLQDDRITSGGCIIETKLGYIDMSLATQMETLRDTIRQINKETNRPELNTAVDDVEADTSPIEDLMANPTNSNPSPNKTAAVTSSSPTHHLSFQEKEETVTEEKAKSVSKSGSKSASKTQQKTASTPAKPASSTSKSEQTSTKKSKAKSAQKSAEKSTQKSSLKPTQKPTPKSKEKEKKKSTAAKKAVSKVSNPTPPRPAKKKATPAKSTRKSTASKKTA